MSQTRETRAQESAKPEPNPRRVVYERETAERASERPVGTGRIVVSVLDKPHKNVMPELFAQIDSDAASFARILAKQNRTVRKLILLYKELTKIAVKAS